MTTKENNKNFFHKFSGNGYALFIFSTFMFAFMGLFVKLVVMKEPVPVFQIVFFRSFINVVLILIYAKFAHKDLRGKNHPLLILRSVIGFIAYTCFVTAVVRTSLADAVILFHTAPVFVAFFAAIMLKDKFSLTLFLSIFFSLFGASLVIKPSFEVLNTGGLFALTSALLASFVFVSVRKLGTVNSSTTIIFYFAAFSTLLALPIAIRDFVAPSGITWVYLISIGIFSTLGQFGMTRGYKCLEAQKGSLISVFQIVVAGALSYFVLDEKIDVYSILGGILVFFSSIGVLIFRPMFFHKHPSHNS